MKRHCVGISNKWNSINSMSTATPNKSGNICIFRVPDTILLLWSIKSVNFSNLQAKWHFHGSSWIFQTLWFWLLSHQHKKLLTSVRIIVRPDPAPLAWPARILNDINQLFTKKRNLKNYDTFYEIRLAEYIHSVSKNCGVCCRHGGDFREKRDREGKADHQFESLKCITASVVDR